MKIRLSRIFLLAFAVLLVGCHKLEATTVVQPNGSGELKMGIGFSAEERENLENQNNNAQDFCNTAQTAENVTVVEEQRGEETWCITITSFKDLEELRRLYEQRKGLRVNRLEIVDGTFYFDMDIDTVSETSDFAVPTEITWSMVLPGTPIEHNADEVLETTLTWAIDPESENVNLRAESEAPQRGFNFPPCGSAFIGLTAALVFLRRRCENQIRVFTVDLECDRRSTSS